MLSNQQGINKLDASRLIQSKIIGSIYFNKVQLYFYSVQRGCYDRMVVGFITTYAVSA
jgi:hypothetical protein